jgi:hypothetical protein
MARLVHMICLFLTFVSFVLNLTAFSSSNWWVALKPQEFERIGLWEICYNHYRHRFDYYGKIYTGCWWHFSPETRMLYSWVETPWYQAVQSFATFSVVTILVSLLPMLMVTFTEAGKISSRFIVGTSILILTSGIKILQLMFLSF